MITHRGDIHHIFPREYLKKNGFRKNLYNQLANYAYMQTEINIQIGNKAPIQYLKSVKEQCSGGKLKYGNITEMKTLMHNLKENCIPENIFDLEYNGYEDFLTERRKLMSKRIKEYYFSL